MASSVLASLPQSLSRNPNPPSAHLLRRPPPSISFSSSAASRHRRRLLAAAAPGGGPDPNDEWGTDPSPPPTPLISDEWGEPPAPEPEATADADPVSNDDEWGNGSSAAPPPAPPAPAAEGEGKTGDLKRLLVDTLYGTELGLKATGEVRGEILELVNQLEAANPTPKPTESAALLDGNWILVYTAFSELLPLLAAGSTPLFKIKKICQEIDTKSQTIVNATTLSSPFATSSFSATASFEVLSPSRIQVKFKEGAFQPPTISSTVSLPPNIEVFGQKIDLSPVERSLGPVQEIVANISKTISGQPPLKIQIPGNRGPPSWLLITYLDEDFRISRGDGGLFVLAKEGSPLLDQLS